MIKLDVNLKNIEDDALCDVYLYANICRWAWSQVEAGRQSYILEESS